MQKMLSTLSLQRAHLRAFVETVGRITLFPYQVEFLNSCLSKKRVVGLFSRQTGKTTLLSLFALYWAINNDKTNTIIIAPTDRQAGELFSRLKVYAENSGLVMPFVELSTQRQISFKNGSLVKALPVGDDGKTIRGQTAHLLILEEASYIKDEIVTQVIMPMIAATNGIVIQIGTPFFKNHFYVASQSPDYSVHKNAWTACPLIQENFIQQQKELMTDMEFRLEYMAEFVEESDNYFTEALIQKSVSDFKMTVIS